MVSCFTCAVGSGYVHPTFASFLYVVVRCLRILDSMLSAVKQLVGVLVWWTSLVSLLLRSSILVVWSSLPQPQFTEQLRVFELRTMSRLFTLMCGRRWLMVNPLPPL